MKYKLSKSGYMLLRTTNIFLDSASMMMELAPHLDVVPEDDGMDLVQTANMILMFIANRDSVSFTDADWLEFVDERFGDLDMAQFMPYLELVK